MYRSLWSLPLGRISGIRIRLDLFLLVFMAVEILTVLPDGWKPVSGAAVAMGILLVSVLLHELGHCWTARRMGGAAEEIILWPLGGVASVDAPRTPKAQFWTAFGGPAVTFLLAASSGLWLFLDQALSLHGLRGWQHGWVHSVFAINLGLLLFNLLPAFPMDGGQMLRALLWTRMGFGRATLLAVRVGKVAAVFMLIAGLVSHQILLCGIAVLNWVACEQERLLLAAGAIGDDSVFGQDFSRGYGSTPGIPETEAVEGPGTDGWWARRRRVREEREAREAKEREVRLRAQVDAILEKITLVGMQGLTRQERQTLQEASDLFRHTRR